MDRGAWWATVCGIAKSRTQLNDYLVIIGNWNAKVGSQELPGIIGRFGLGVQNEAGQQLTEFCQENTLVITNTQTSLHMDITRWSYRNLIIFFAAKDGDALCSQQKQDQELTVAQIMNPLLQNSDLN